LHRAVNRDAEGGARLKRVIWVFAGLLSLFATVLLLSCQRAGDHWRREQKLIILGMDGMDPQLLVATDATP